MHKDLFTAIGSSGRLDGKKRITVRNARLLPEIAQSKNRKHPQRRMVLFSLLLISLAAALVFLVSSFVFLIGDVLLFNRPPVITDAGAIVLQRSCNREQAIFYFSASDYWAPTGITLNRGDRIRISVSGGFYSDIADLFEASRINRRPKYSYLFGLAPRRNSPADTACKYTIYPENRSSSDPEKKARFGSVLWTVSDWNILHGRERITSDIRQIEKETAKKYQKIECSGELFFSVNDIYLSDSVVEELLQQEAAKKFSKKQVSVSRQEAAQARAALVPLCIREKIDSSSIDRFSDTLPLAVSPADPDAVKSYLRTRPELREIWFQDNVGSLLICVEIERKLTLAHGMSYLYRLYERTIDTVFGFDNRSADFHTAIVILLAGIATICAWGLFILLLYFLLRRAIRLSDRLVRSFKRLRQTMPPVSLEKFRKRLRRTP